MRLYVAGPMSGCEEFNFPAFNKAAKDLRLAGYEVINPAEMDLAAGIDPINDGFTRDDWHKAMRRDIEALLTVDGIALLPNWKASEGARAEVVVGKALGLAIRPVNGFLFASLWISPKGFSRDTMGSSEVLAYYGDTSGSLDFSGYLEPRSSKDLSHELGTSGAAPHHGADVGGHRRSRPNVEAVPTTKVL